MRIRFRYTGVRVRDLDKAVDFFTDVLGMKVQARVNARWNKGVFVNLVSADGKNWLELNWYADGSPVAGPYSEGEQLDHLGFETDDFEGTLERLKQAGYPSAIGPIKSGKWRFAFVKAVDGIWLDVFHISRPSKKKPTKKKRGK
jgi:lactoylglutathione lyase